MQLTLVLASAETRRYLSHYLYHFTYGGNERVTRLISLKCVHLNFYTVETMKVIQFGGKLYTITTKFGGNNSLEATNLTVSMNAFSPNAKKRRENL